MDPARCREAVVPFFFEVLGLRALGLSFVASADVYVVFLGSFFETPNFMRSERNSNSQICI